MHSISADNMHCMKQNHLAYMLLHMAHPEQTYSKMLLDHQTYAEASQVTGSRLNSKAHPQRGPTSHLIDQLRVESEPLPTLTAPQQLITLPKLWTILSKIP